MAAIINTSAEVADLLALVLHDEGFRTVTAYVPDLKGGKQDLGSLLRQYDTRVVVWDIALPYEENWAFFQHARTDPAAHGRRFVLTTTNKHVLEHLVGPTGAHELIGKPFDLDELAQAVRRALADGTGRGTAPPL